MGKQINEEKKGQAENMKPAPSQNGSAVDEKRAATEQPRKGRKENGKGKGGSGKGGNPNNKPQNCPKSNDPKWYSNDPVLFEQATNIQTIHINGLPYRLGLLPGVTKSNNVINPDGVIRLNYDAQIAGSRELSDPLNRSMLNLFNTIRGKYTSSVPFGPVDLTSYFVSVGSILCLISFIKNCLDWVNTYDPQNAQVPNMLIRSALDSDIIKESKEYATNIFNLNVQINRLSSLAIPDGINYLERCSWLGRKIYYEDKMSGMRGNLIYFCPHSLYKFTNKAKNVSGKLTGSGLERFVLAFTSIGKLIDQLSIMITLLVNDDNIRQMSGWIYTYLDKNNKVSYVLSYATRDPEQTVYDDEVIDIIHNCKLVHCPESGKTSWSDDSSYIIDYFTDCNKIYASDVATKHVVDFPEQATRNVLMRFMEKPTKDQIMVASRMAHTWTEKSDGNYYLDCDMFTVSNIIYTYLGENFVPTRRVMNTYFYDNRIPEDGEFSNIYPKFEMSTMTDGDIILVGSFNVLPARYVCTFDNTHRGFASLRPIQNVDFNFELTGEDLHNLNVVAVLSQFNFKPYDNSDSIIKKS